MILTRKPNGCELTTPVLVAVNLIGVTDWAAEWRSSNPAASSNVNVLGNKGLFSRYVNVWPHEESLLLVIANGWVPGDVKVREGMYL